MCIGRPKKLRFFFVSYHIVLYYVSHHTEDIPGKTYNNKSMRQDLSGPFNLSCSLRRKKKKTLSWWDQSRQRPLGAVGGASDLDFSFPSEHIKLGFSGRYFFFHCIFNAHAAILWRNPHRKSSSTRLGTKSTFSTQAIEDATVYMCMLLLTQVYCWGSLGNDGKLC